MSLENFGLFTKNLFDDAIETVLARTNYKKIDFTEDLIVVDDLTPAVPLSNIDRFDGVNEKMNYDTFVSQLVTIDFYGDSALDNANQYLGLLRSQKATELKSTYDLNVYSPSSITDLKEQINTNWFNRYQIELTISYMINVEISTLRIETPDLQISINK